MEEKNMDMKLAVLNVAAAVHHSEGDSDPTKVLATAKTFYAFVKGITDPDPETAA